MSQLRSKDVLPALRADLVVNHPPRGAGAEVIEVAPSGEPRARPMWGFEFSIARMLDGRRTAGEVMTSAARIGLPLDLASLEGLLHQLEAKGLLADAQHPGVKAEGPPRQRKEWSPEARELYRACLRLARQGELGRAVETAEALLVLEPGNEEALALRAWAFDQAWSEPGRPPFGEVLQRAEKAWRSEEIVEAPESVLPAAGPKTPAWAWGLFAALLLLGGLLVLVPVPSAVKASATFSPVLSEPLLSTREGRVEDVMVKVGDLVARGDELLAWSTEASEDALLEARDQLDAVRGPLRAALGQTPEGRPLYVELLAAEAGVARAQSELLRAQKDAAGIRFDDSLLGYEWAFAQALARRDAAQEALDALVPDDAPDAAEAAQKEMEVALLQGEVRYPFVRAPVSGVVSKLEVAPGDDVEIFQPLVTIDDVSQLRLVVTVTPRVTRHLAAGDRVRVVVDGRTYRTRVDAVNGNEVVLRVANRGRLLAPGVGEVTLELPRRTVWER